MMIRVPMTLFFVLVAGCTRSPGPVAEADLAALPTQESWDVVLRIDEGEQPLVVLSAPYAARFDGDDSTYTRLEASPDTRSDSAGVTVTLFDEQGVRTAVVHAEQIHYFDKERRFTAEGQVVVQAEETRRLESSRVTWSEDTRELRAPGAFRFFSPAERIEGTNLVAAEDLSRYRFTAARGELEVEE